MLFLVWSAMRLAPRLFPDRPAAGPTADPGGRACSLTPDPAPASTWRRRT